jgi:hypothetical protein
MTSITVTKHNTTQHNNTTTMKSGKKLRMNLGSIQGNDGKKHTRSSDNTSKNSNGPNLPPPVVETVVSSSQSLASSIGIGIGEFGMNQACKRSAIGFSMAVKDQLFPTIKFLKGTNASLDYSLDTTSICGFLQINCGVSEADAYSGGGMTTT